MDRTKKLKIKPTVVQGNRGQKLKTFMLDRMHLSLVLWAAHSLIFILQIQVKNSNWDHMNKKKNTHQNLTYSSLSPPFFTKTTFDNTWCVFSVKWSIVWRISSFTEGVGWLWTSRKFEIVVGDFKHGGTFPSPSSFHFAASVWFGINTSSNANVKSLAMLHNQNIH